jgi:serine kinase of HPr protein (carbohydrate metabolism regulator)
MTLIHASCIAIGHQAVLILGPAGAGKSDLALRLIDEGAYLVADDQVEVKKREGTLYASAPERLSGLIEIYGVGLLKGLKVLHEAPLALVVELVEPHFIERLPLPNHFTLDDVHILKIKLAPFEASAPAKIHAILKGQLLPQDSVL